MLCFESIDSTPFVDHHNHPESEDLTEESASWLLDVLCQEPSMKVVANGIIDETLRFFLWFSCLVLEYHIVVPTTLDSKTLSSWCAKSCGIQQGVTLQDSTVPLRFVILNSFALLADRFVSTLFFLSVLVLASALPRHLLRRRHRRLHLHPRFGWSAALWL